MQGKEASEQETQKCIAGIDVSKSWLDAHILPSESLRVANTSIGIRQLKRWLLKHKADLVAVEATGRLHREVYRSLAASQIAVAVTNPFKVRMFAKAAGIAAKTASTRRSWLSMPVRCHPSAGRRRRRRLKPFRN